MLEGLTVERITLSADGCWTIMETAVEAARYGIGYWAAVTELERKGDEMLLAIEDHEGIEKAGDEPKVYRLRAAQIRSAVLAILRNPDETEARMAARRIFDADSIDGPLADQIIQVACFGKVLYG